MLNNVLTVWTVFVSYMYHLSIHRLCMSSVIFCARFYYLLCVLVQQQKLLNSSRNVTIVLSFIVLVKQRAPRYILHMLNRIFTSTTWWSLPGPVWRLPPMATNLSRVIIRYHSGRVGGGSCLANTSAMPHKSNTSIWILF